MEKINLKFLVPHNFASLDLLRRPGPDNAGGGLGIKYARIEHAGLPDFNCTRIRTPYDVTLGCISKGDIVFADFMWLVCDQGGTTRTDRAKSFIEIDNSKIIIGSEFCISTLPRSIADQEIESADIITHNCDHLRNLFGTIGIYDSRFLCDPVPSAFYPSRYKRPRLVCLGNINERKNTKEVVTIFERLKDTDIELVFLGGCSMWGHITANKEYMAIQNQIESLADIFIENATQEEVASICNEATFYAHFSIHDISSYSMQENMTSGNIVFGLRHPILKERPAYRFDTSYELAEAIKNYSLDSEQYKTDLDLTLKASQKWSYNAWRNQISDILERL